MKYTGSNIASVEQWQIQDLTLGGVDFVNVGWGEC